MRLPTYQEAERRVLDEDEDPSLIDIFIYNCSPDGYEEQSTFRWHLQRLIDSLTSKQETTK